jgi:hypothetical protein
VHVLIRFVPVGGHECFWVLRSYGLVLKLLGGVVVVSLLRSKKLTLESLVKLLTNLSNCQGRSTHKYCDLAPTASTSCGKRPWMCFGSAPGSTFGLKAITDVLLTTFGVCSGLAPASWCWQALKTAAWSLVRAGTLEHQSDHT